MTPLEKDLEAIIEQSLIEQGYQKRSSKEYDLKLCLITQDVIQFLEQTQSKEWAKYLGNPGNDSNTFLRLLAKRISEYGTLQVLRNPFETYGCTFQLAYFQPSTNRNPELQELYSKNILVILRQFHYSETYPSRSLDWGLFLNGLPIFTAELKNHFTGQTVEHAKHQYKTQRNPDEPLFQFKRCLCHFAIDPDVVEMTTYLQGENTRFLPFNKGYDKGAGNPPDRDGCRTRYLSDEIWSPDSFLNLVENFIQLEVEKKKDDQGKKITEERLIFPRYHQLDAVRTLLADARTNGTGQTYLIQHSTGSGKSNTIAWLAHQCINLFDDNQQRIFDTAIVISDRRIINKQLQANVAQFEQTPGTVATPKNGKQLREALQLGKLIIVCTLQLFPEVLRQLKIRTNKRFALLIDEAHSSQGGETTRDLSAVLALEPNSEDLEEPDIKDLVAAAADYHGHLSNVSYFAFTATPKQYTLERFGTLNKDGEYDAFHLYSMKQAIEEGFILDVLENYTTYDQYSNLIKTTADDPHCDPGRATRLIQQLVDLDEEALAQKVAVIMEHFCNRVERRINGKAKAMLVARSRPQAVRYQQAVMDYLQQHQLDFKVLVAFSGTVKLNEQPYTETQMNTQAAGKTINAEQTAETFALDEYRILIVANKYQVGFDEKRLHTMYVDKPLQGIKAVQTLSRLNRCYPGKNETMVLDFVNQPATIRTAFKKYYSSTRFKQGTDPNELYTFQHQLQTFRFYSTEEVATVAIRYYENQKAVNRIEAAIAPIVDRYRAAEQEDQNSFRFALSQYVKLYAYLCQIIQFKDRNLEALYVFGKLLLGKLQRPSTDLPFVLPSGIDLEFSLQKISSGKIELTSEGAELAPTKVQGTNLSTPRKAVQFSTVIQEWNRRYGLNDETATPCIEEVLNRLEGNQELKRRVEVNGERAKPTFDETVSTEMDEMFIEDTSLGSSISFREFYEKVTADQNLNRELLSLLFTQFCRSLNSQQKNNTGEV